MFNIIKTPRNYILQANYYTTVMWHFTAKSHWRPYWEVSYSGKYSAGPVLPLWSRLTFTYYVFVTVFCWQKNLWKYGDFREDEDKEFGYRP